MQLKTDLSPVEIREAARLMRPKNFWLKFLAASWYATILLLLGLGVLIDDTLIRHQPPKWSAIGVCLGLAALRYGISWTRWNARQEKAAAALKPGLGTLSLESTGIRSTLQNGAMSFVPWASYNKWAEGKDVFVVMGSAGPVILPVDAANRDSVRGLLQSHIA